MKNFTVNISTKADKDSAPDARDLAFDMSCLNANDFEEYARRAIIIQAQSVWRAWQKSDKSKPDPWSNNVYVVPKPGTRTSDPTAKLEKVRKMLASLPPELRAALLESTEGEESE